MSKYNQKNVYDWKWRLNNFYYIVDKKGRKVRYTPNSIQRAINENKNRWQIILKARQFGVSTNGLLRMLDYVCFNKNKTACIVAHKRDTLEKLFSIVRYAHLNIPEAFRPEVAKGGGSKFELYFPKMNSRIFVTLDLRGGTVNWLHISESAFTEKERVDATLESVSVDHGIVVFESTPNGIGNHFYQDWINQDHKAAKLFFPWYIHDEYKIDTDQDIKYTDNEKDLIRYAKKHQNIKISKEQIAFRRFKMQTSKVFRQEYPENPQSCFLSSGNTAFDLEFIADILKDVKEPVHKTDTLEIYKPFDKTKNYVCGADTAEGKGGDYSVGVIYEVDSMEQCAQIRSNKWKPRIFADELNDLCLMYSKPGRIMPLLAVELNNHGHAVMLQLEDHLSYTNLYECKEGTNGWLTNSVTRPLMLDAFIDGVEDEIVVLNSYDTLNECLTFVNNKGKLEAEVGQHDDTIIASAIALQMCIKERSNLSLYDNISDKILL